MARNQDQNEGNGTWLWVLFIVFVVFFLMNRFGGHVYPWNQ